MKNTLAKPIIGYLTPYGHGPNQNPTPIGLQTLLLGTPGQPFVQDIDASGDVRGFLPVQSLAAHEYVALPIPTEPQIGQPHLCALVTSQDGPRSMLVASWTDMVGHVLESYPRVRADLLRHPVAGVRLAGFVLGQSPRYAAANRSGPHRAFERYEFELNRLRIDDERFFRNAPEVEQLRASASSPTPPTANHPTP